MRLCRFYRQILFSIIYAVVRSGCYGINCNLFVNKLVLNVSILVNLCQRISFLLFPREPKALKGVCNRLGNWICQADLTQPDPFNICPQKSWGGGSDPCSAMTLLVTRPATHHLLFQTYEFAYCLQMLIVCVFLSNTETTLHIYLSLTGLLSLTCWYLNILAVAGVMMSVSNMAVRNICIICSCRIITLSCSVVFVQDKVNV